MSSEVFYKPKFSKNEFRFRTPHYRIKATRANLRYAYIRKNACTAFKHLINSRTHPRYVVARLLRRNKHKFFHVRGNMSYYRADIEDGQRDEGELNFFVYRDPVDRFVSTYIHKFIRLDNAHDILKSYEALTDLDPDQASICDFLAYARHGIKQLDCHMRPQKSHLFEARYLAISIEDLQSSMAKFIGTTNAEKFFAPRYNSTNTDLLSHGVFLGDLPARELREWDLADKTFGKSDFVSDEIENGVREIYWQDYQMLEDIRRAQVS